MPQGPYRKPDVNDILRKYGSKIEGQMNTSSGSKRYSREYTEFKNEISSELRGYEKWCKSLEL